MSKVKVATVWLDGCSGCHMSLLDMDAAIIALAEKIDIVYGPLVDAQEFPDEVDVTLVEGAVSSQDDLAKIQKVRQHTHILVAMGDCGITGNVPAMRNSVPVPRLLQAVYGNSDEVPRRTVPGEVKNIPFDGVPALLKEARPIREFVQVDLSIPGCPPPAHSISGAILALLDGKKPESAVTVKFG